MAYVLGTVLIAKNSVIYIARYEIAPFVIDKGAIAHEEPWKTLLLVHVFSGLTCLVACSLQFSKQLRVRVPILHRALGLIFAWVLLLTVLPSGFFLSLYATGGLAGSIGFLFNGMLALCFTVLGLRSYRLRRITEHGAWMIRAFAMVTAAITFRYLHVALNLVGMPETFNYVLSLWGGILFNYAVAEIVIARLPIFRSQARVPIPV